MVTLGPAVSTRSALRRKLAFTTCFEDMIIQSLQTNWFILMSVCDAIRVYYERACVLQCWHLTRVITDVTGSAMYVGVMAWSWVVLAVWSLDTMKHTNEWPTTRVSRSPVLLRLRLSSVVYLGSIKGPSTSLSPPSSVLDTVGWVPLWILDTPLTTASALAALAID